MSIPRPEKDLALSLVSRLALDYLEFFRDIQKPDGWRTFSKRVAASSRPVGGVGSVARQKKAAQDPGAAAGRANRVGRFQPICKFNVEV
jgi:hypothetical protein